MEVSVAAELSCDYCPAILHKNVTLVHTERYYGLWDLDGSLCSNCMANFKAILEKVKRQKSWTGWADLEHEVAALKRDKTSLEAELQFLRYEDPTSDQLMKTEPHYEVVTVWTPGGDSIKAHRSVLVNRSSKFVDYFTSSQSKKYMEGHKAGKKHTESYKISDFGNMTPGLTLPMHMKPDSFRAFMGFLKTAELKPEDLKDHVSELVTAGATFKIQLLQRKCEAYMVEHMTPENTIHYLEVASQCQSKSITAAAVKQMQSDPDRYMSSHEYKALKQKHPEVIVEAFQCAISDPSTAMKKEIHANNIAVAKEVDAEPGSDPAVTARPPRELSFTLLGMCTCPVHPFAHSASPALGFHDFRPLRFPTASASAAAVAPRNSSAPEN